MKDEHPLFIETDVILASSSPRRKELLKNIISEFTQHPANVDETPRSEECPESLVERLSYDKAHFVQNNFPSSIIIGSDTVVAHQEIVLGKPKDYTDFLGMMRLLSNSTHNVFTGVCVLHKGKRYTRVVTTKVTMSDISEQKALTYWQTNEPSDKAGGYAIQGIGGQFVVKIHGSFSAVVGLPLFETRQLIEQALGNVQ